MNIYQSNNLQELKNFDKYPAQLGIIERDIPSGAKEFFKKLMITNGMIIVKRKKTRINKFKLLALLLVSINIFFMLIFYILFNF